MKALLAVAAVVAVVAAAGSARAEILITVDPTAPFTERDLAEAVHLRCAEPAPDVTVRVGRLGFDHWLVAVGDKTETVALPDRDRAEAARVVAVVVTSLVEGGGPPGAAIASDAPIDAPTRGAVAPSHSLWSVMLGAGLEHEAMKLLYMDDGLDVTMLRGGVARTLAPSLRAIATVGLGLLKPEYETHTRFVPIRVGVEATAGPLGFEIGGQNSWFSNEGCNGHWGHSYSVYGIAKILVPVSTSTKLVLEAGGHYVVEDPSGPNWDCERIGDFIHYGASANAGVEWAL